MNKMPQFPTIETTLLESLEPEISANTLLQRVRRVHPEATKKDIILAAFNAVIALAEHDPERAKALHDFAMNSRGS